MVRLLNRRGGRLERTHRNPYSNALRALVCKGRGNEEPLDRFLISALIEARSCERFEVLARWCADREPARFDQRRRYPARSLERLTLALHTCGPAPGRVREHWELCGHPIKELVGNCCGHVLTESPNRNIVVYET